MLDILGTASVGSRGVAVESGLLVKGDDDGLWYSAGLSYDSGLGIYLWSVGLSSLPSGTVNISDRVIGSAIPFKDAVGSWHTFAMTATDTPNAFVWTDYSQSASTPAAFSRRPSFRADNGVYIVDLYGSQIHKMGVTGGLWAELNQGYTIPM